MGYLMLISNIDVYQHDYQWLCLYMYRETGWEVVVLCHTPVPLSSEKNPGGKIHFERRKRQFNWYIFWTPCLAQNSIIKEILL